jgi:hypothetical protein
MKRLLTLLIALSFVGSTTVAYAELTGENYYPSVKQENGWMGATFMDSIDNAGTSFLYSTTNFDPKATPETRKMNLCSSAAVAPCNDQAIGLMFRAVFPQCKSAESSDCIEKFSIKNPDGTISDGVFDHEWVENSFFPASADLGLPAGRGTSTWIVDYKGQKKTYAVITGVNGSRNPWALNRTKVWYDRFFASVQPVSIKYGGYFAQNPNVTHRADGDGPGWNTGFIEQGCEVVEAGRCGYRESFSLEDSVILTVRLSQPVNGWLHGRMRNADISLETNADQSQRISIEANPLKVPSVVAWAKWGDLPQAIKDLYPVGAGGTSRNFNDFVTTDLANRTLLSGPGSPAGERAIRELNLWLPFISDKAAAMKTMWTIRTIDGQLGGDLSKCAMGSGFTGVIGTNASVYSDGPPKLDQATNSLSYTVGAPHYETDGTVFGGFYQINLRSDVARCLYQFTDAPIQAKIEVASSDGSTEIATTTVSENNGWLKLTAGGFHYSTPQIKISLSQEKKAEIVTPVPVVTPEPIAPVVVVPTKAPVAKKITITCVKGKTTKKVTAVKPVCPKGYRKK